jgi:hypothetical protein
VRPITVHRENCRGSENADGDGSFADHTDIVPQRRQRRRTLLVAQLGLARPLGLRSGLGLSGRLPGARLGRCLLGTDGSRRLGLGLASTLGLALLIGMGVMADLKKNADMKRARFSRLRALGLIVVLGGVLSGCYPPYGPGPGWCYWHPYRC